MCKACFTLCLLCLIVRPVFADAVGVELITLTSHISHYTIQLGEQYHRKLTANGRHLITPGVEVYYDKYIQQILKIESMRGVFAVYLDSMNHLSGYIAFTPRWSFFQRKKYFMNFGVGPTLIFRESWNNIPAYQDDGYYHESGGKLGGYQYKWIIGGDVNFHYRVKQNTELVWSIIPGLPYIITHAFGMRRLF